MSVVNYLTVDGEILSETRDGVERDYLPDPLGNTVALLDSTQSKTDTFTYWPYGETRSHTGTNPTPFTWVGTLGYYSDASGAYARARTVSKELGRWVQVDPLWPEESAYGYVGGRPVSQSDRWGLWFGYGNYCGARDGHGGVDPTINAVDACCKDHDKCLATLTCWLNPLHEKECDCVLCACLAKSIIPSCGYNLICYCSALKVMQYACGSCLTSPLGGLLGSALSPPFTIGCYILG
jgi:RHS repeat-associated protein